MEIQKTNAFSNFYSAENCDFNYLYSDHLTFSKKLFVKVDELFQKYNVKSIIDCCCGVGNDLTYFAKKGYDVFGSDISFDMVDMAKKNLIKENINPNIIQSDVLDIKNNICSKFDLVIFRGNTLGHLNCDQQGLAIDNLFSITKSNGLIFIDFRNGQVYHRKKKGIELRGHGIDKHNSNVYFSYYLLVHPQNIGEKYKIRSKTFIYDYRNLKFRSVYAETEAYYVIPNKILERISLNNGEVLFELMGKGGLQELQSFIILKK